MGRAILTPPDTVKTVIAYLNAALVEPVSSKIPNPRPAAFVTVQRKGGARWTAVSDGPNLAIECWAGSDGAAEALSAEVRELVQEMADGTNRAGVVIYRYEEFSGPAYLPDPASTQDRFTWTCRLHARLVEAPASA